MFKDKISNMEKIDIGDHVYVYQYRKRKKIEFFQDLDFIKVTEIVPKNKPSDPIMVGGIKTICNKGILNDENVVGFVDYIRHGDIIQTSEGDKFINYFIKNNEMILCLRKIKEEYEYCRLKAIFQLDKKIEIKISPYDLICFNEENLLNLIKFTKITHTRLHNGYISYFLNGEEIHINDFEIYINNKKYNGYDGVEQIFKWACENKNEINEANFNFQKIFSMKLTNFELVPVNLKK